MSARLPTVATFRVGQRVRITTDAFQLIPNQLDYRKGDILEITHVRELYCVGMVNGVETVVWMGHLERVER